MAKATIEVHESHIPVFETNNARYIILMGGRANGRSGTASRYAVTRLLGKEYTRGAIMRATREDIRASCWGEIMDRLGEMGIRDMFKITDNEMFMEIGQNSIRAHGFRASSGSLTARLKSLAGYNFVWIEEAEEIGENEFRTLDDTLRTVKGKITIILSLNTPPKSHWIIKKWFDLLPTEEQGFYRPKIKEGLTDAIYIGGTYRENLPNLDEHTIERYKAYKDTNPSYYWQVIEGLSPDEVRGKIFTGWQLVDGIPQGARLVKLGEDYGWSPDPACLVAIYYWNGSYVIDELAYGTELSNEYLAGEATKLTGKGSEIACIADSAEPKSIAEQRKYGMNVTGCEKGKDSVMFRIKVTSQKKIYVTRRSKNVWESYENYKWAEDKDGNSKGVPDHTWSHCFSPETLVHTTKGKVRIDELVGKEGFLYSELNKVKRFHDVRATRTNTEVLTLDFDDGDKITITPDHLIRLVSENWCEAQLLCLGDIIQSGMYEEDNISIYNFYKIYWREVLQRILQRAKGLFAQSYLARYLWGNTQKLSYSSQGWQQRKQYLRELGIKTQNSSLERSYDTKTQSMAKEMGGKDKTICGQMAWVKRGDSISQMAWEEKLGRKKTYYERMLSLPHQIRNAYQSFKRKILFQELLNERQTKKIIGITRGFSAITYNMEVEDTHCLQANGILAHNCMDSVSYAIASMHNNLADEEPEYTRESTERKHPAR